MPITIKNRNNLNYLFISRQKLIGHANESIYSTTTGKDCCFDLIQPLAHLLHISIHPLQTDTMYSTKLGEQLYWPRVFFIFYSLNRGSSLLLRCALHKLEYVDYIPQHLAVSLYMCA